jgi:hypothetical protein
MWRSAFLCVPGNEREKPSDRDDGVGWWPAYRNHWITCIGHTAHPEPRPVKAQPQWTDRQLGLRQHLLLLIRFFDGPLPSLFSFNLLRAVFVRDSPCRRDMSALEILGVLGTLSSIIYDEVRRFFNIILSCFTAFARMLSRNILFWHKRKDSKLTAKSATVQITPGSDALENAMKAKIVIQGIIERNPSMYGTSPVVVLRTLRVGGTQTREGQPTLAILSRSEEYNKQLKKAIEENKDLDMNALGLHVMTEEELFKNPVAIEELAAEKSGPKKGVKIENPNAEEGASSKKDLDIAFLKAHRRSSARKAGKSADQRMRV